MLHVRYFIEYFDAAACLRRYYKDEFVKSRKYYYLYVYYDDYLFIYIK